MAGIAGMTGHGWRRLEIAGDCWKQHTKAGYWDKNDDNHDNDDDQMGWPYDSFDYLLVLRRLNLLFRETLDFIKLIIFQSYDEMQNYPKNGLDISYNHQGLAREYHGQRSRVN